MEKFSHSKLEVYNQCPFKYKLIYVDKHFIHSNSIATDFGSLIHFIEETMGNDIKDNDNEPDFLIDENKYIDLLFNLDDSEKGIYGINKLKEMYPEDFYIKDKHGLSYNDKTNIYVKDGIKRLRSYMRKNRDLQLIGLEQKFELEYNGYIFQGSIDRVFKDISTGEIIVEDIKTYSAPLDHDKLVTPIQFVIYTLAARELYKTENISCAYELPLCGCKQSAGTKGYIERGKKKLDKMFQKIEDKDFKPKPQVLCHWCIFCKTNQNQPEEAKNLCPYYSHWTRENKTNQVEYEWMGEENHEAILKSFIEKYNDNSEPIEKIVVKVDEFLLDKSRRFIVRRED